MTNFLPRGRGSIPKELMAFGKHLVYMEGTATEPLYVKDIKGNIARKYNCNINDIDIIPASDKNKTYHTVELVKYAKRDVNNRLKKGEQINHVWIFFDKDSFTDFNDAHKLIIKQNNSKDKNQEGFSYNKETEISWHSCWSNECFELWLWLYYDYTESALSRDNYKEKLEKQKELKAIGFIYEKNLENIHSLLSSHGGDVRRAIRNAKKLEEGNGQNNPSTGVYLFMEYFLPYMVE